MSSVRRGMLVEAVGQRGRWMLGKVGKIDDEYVTIKFCNNHSSIQYAKTGCTDWRHHKKGNFQFAFISLFNDCTLV